MTILRRQRHPSIPAVPLELFEAARLSLPAIGLYCWLGDEPRTSDEALARFGLSRAQLAMLLVPLAAAGFIKLEESGL